MTAWDPLEYQREQREKARAFSGTGNRSLAKRATVAVESLAERKRREDAERAAILARSAIAPAKPEPEALRERAPRSVVLSNGDRVLLSDKQHAAIQAQHDAARERCAQRSTETKSRRVKSDGPSYAVDARGVIRPTGEGSIPPPNDTAIALEAFRFQLVADMRAGLVSEADARRILRDARSASAEDHLQVTGCRNMTTGDPCDGSVMCQRCGGKGFLTLALPSIAPQFVDAFPGLDTIGWVTLRPVNPECESVRCPVTRGALDVEADRLLMVDASWATATIERADGTPLYFATYWDASGAVERDEKGAPMRTSHDSEDAARLAAGAWIANNPGSRVTVGLTRADALRANPERERQTRRTYSEPLQAMAAKHGPESVPVDDPRLASSRRDGCVLKVRPRVGLPMTSAMAKAMRPR